MPCNKRGESQDQSVPLCCHERSGCATVWEHSPWKMLHVVNYLQAHVCSVLDSGQVARFQPAFCFCFCFHRVQERTKEVCPIPVFHPFCCGKRTRKCETPPLMQTPSPTEPSKASVASTAVASWQGWIVDEMPTGCVLPGRPWLSQNTLQERVVRNPAPGNSLKKVFAEDIQPL